MTLVYARISNDTVAEQYFRATQVGRGGRRAQPLSIAEARLLAQGHQRLLGNGHCTRPAQLDCAYQTICEGCGFFETGPEFLPILRRQKDNATEQADFERSTFYQELIDGLTTDKPLGADQIARALGPTPIEIGAENANTAPHFSPAGHWTRATCPWFHDRQPKR